jgi:hypothetical protein
MRTLLLTLFLAAVVVLGLGFYLGWFTFTAQRDPATDQVHLKFDVHRGKIAQDAKRAEEQVSEAARRAKGAAEKAIDAVKSTHRAKGELVKVDGADARLTIHTEDNKTLTVQTQPETKIRRHGVDVNMDNLTEGDHLLVEYREENGRNVAQAITVKPKTD